MRGERREFFQGFTQPGERLFGASFPAALHRADNRRRAEAAGQADHRGDKFPRPTPGLRVGIGQAQLVSHPTGACSDRGELELVCRQELSDMLNVELLRRPREDFDRIEPQLGSLLTAAGQVVPENKRTAPSLGEERDGDGGLHACDMLTVRPRSGQTKTRLPVPGSRVRSRIS